VRILELKCCPVGPLSRPVFFQSEKNCVVVYDENEAGKTSLVDIIVNMLFRRGSAQSRFQARRFDDYQGYVKLEHQGKTWTCEGSIDLDKLLGLPSEFSRLPIVRGSDLHFLWSSNREKKGPLIEACIQHFTADCENNLGALAAGVRSAAGLTAKRNSWTRSKTEELKGYLDLYRKKEFLLSGLANREKIKRELQSVSERLQAVKKKLAAAIDEQKRVAEEHQAAICSAAEVWERKLSALRTEYREGGYERCSREDLQLWAESAAKEQSLKEREKTLKSQISDTEIKTLELRQQQEKLSRCLKETEESCAAARDTLARLRQEKEAKAKEHSALRTEAQTLLHSINSAEEQKKRIRWAVVAGPLFTVAAVVLFLAGQLVPGLLLLAAGLVIIGWSRTVAGMCSRTFKEAEEKLLELARRAGIQAIGTADELVKLLESQLARQAEEMSKALEKAELECREQEGILNGFVQERLLCERELDRLAENLRDFHSSLAKCARELDGIRSTLEQLMHKSGKGDFASLEEAVKQREGMERDMELAATRLKTLLGSEEQWRERLLALKPYLEQHPHPRSVDELDGEKARLEALVLELREEEEELQQQYDKLQQQELDESQNLYAAGCGDTASLALRLQEAEEQLKKAIRESLAAVWVEKAVEAAKGDLEAALLEPLSQAAEIFYAITGRYNCIDYSRQGKDVSFRVSGLGTAYSEDLLSDGARAQLLMALRLALLERALGAEPGFLVLDDPLLNSSLTRKRKTIEVLLNYARRGWQLFYLTVDYPAVEIFRELGGELVEFNRVCDFYE
jgi:DNA repair exonuclease SbcCD ATPase subunit